MHRKAVVAGHFYEGKKERLIEEIKECFLKGPGKLPEVKKNGGKIKGLVVPHAGYMYSGYVAAFAYYEIAQDFPDKFIILGPNHHGYGASVAIMSEGTWETPLGEIEIAEDARKYCRGIIKDDEIAHRYEHSIEVQLPFLQFLSSDFTFIPICFGWQDWDTVKEAADILKEAEDAVFIASSDFSHVNFSGFPTPDDIDEFVKKKDMLAIEKILQLDAKGLVEIVEEKNITMCGYGAVATMLEALKGRAREAKLLKYATSYDIEPGTYCVGYAAIAII
ncbi:MAG TPA: AmmeMemoRadiSam system protein B [Thermoplasmatales archaeon]|nr:AmmeMemoRadiSam system protein B [Thermoplasmatales archaeon]